MKTYEPADDVRAIANGTVIPQWHPECSELNIAYLFTEELGVSKGRVKLAQIKKASGLEAHLGAVDAILVVDRTIWDGLDTAKRIALVDHEFCHLQIDDDGNLGIIGHDLEEFCAVVKRHGAWSEDISQFNQAQMDLLGGLKEA